MTDRSRRSRRSTRRDLKPTPGAPEGASQAHPIGTPPGLVSSTGMLATAAWLSARGLQPPGHTWDVEIGLDVTNAAATHEFDERRASRFQLMIYAEEWGFRFCHAGRASWIRVTDIAFVHGRDDYELLPVTPLLKNVATFVRELEEQHGLRFHRSHASLRTTIPNAERSIRDWLASL